MAQKLHAKGENAEIASNGAASPLMKPIAYLKNRLASVPETEHEQALLRLVIIAAILAY